MFRDDDDTDAASQIIMSVPEDESLEEGDPVGQPVTATDIGEDGNQEVLTYRISGGANQVLFTIDSASGQLELAAAPDPILDFEHTRADNSLEVQVTATDPSGLEGMTAVTINVTQVDEAPSISGDVTTRTYAENLDETVLSYTATDEDADDNDADLSWSLSGRDAADFNITETGATALLTFVSPPNFERPADNGSNNVYDVVVEVSDDAGNEDTRSVTVTVTNAEDPATMTLTSHPQPEVGQAIRVTLQDEDRTGNVTWNWTVGTATSSQVTGASASYTPRVNGGLTVTATYQNSFGDATRTVNLDSPPSVQNRPDPDTKPEFPSSENGERTIAENSNAADPVGTPVDAADTTDGTLLYTLGGTDARSFTLADRASGQISVAEGVDLNYERKRTYSVTVTATDPTGSVDRATQNVTITLTDVPEAPEITSGDTAISYAENGSGIVQRYTATDDENDAARPQIPLVWSLTGNDAADFSISNAGVLTFNSSPDFEALADNNSDNVYSVTVNVNDGDNTTDNATRDVAVTVTNVEEAGVVTGLPAQPKVEIPMSVILTDDDGPVSEQVGDNEDGDNNEKTITSNASTTWQWSRSRSRSSGWTTITATSTDNMDVNTNTRRPEPADVGHYLRATATYSDGEGDGKVAHGITPRVVLAKEYINTAPIFRDDDDQTTGTQITMEVNEDDSLEAGDAVGEPVTATDIGPLGTQEILVYTLDVEAADRGTDQDSFTIDSSSGQLKLAGAAMLDFENPSDNGDGNDYVVRVKALDPSSASSTALVTIEVQPVDENPVIEAEVTDTGMNLTSTTTPESSTASTTVLSTYAGTDDEDNRESPREDVGWTLDGADKDLFRLCTDVDSNTCPDEISAATVQLTFKNAVDYEKPADSGRNNKYDVTVVATDSDDMTATRPVVVTVDNSDEEGTVTLSNLQPEVGTPITASVTDPDGGITGLTWQWHWATSDEAPDNPEPNDAWTLIRGATSNTYTPVTGEEGDMGDVGRHIRATAIYNDRAPNPADDAVTTDRDESKFNYAEVPSEYPAQAMRASNATPQFSDQDTNLTGNQTVRYIVENAGDRAGVVVNVDGATPADPVNDDYVTATDADGALTTPNAVPADVLTYSLSGTDKGSFEISRESGQITLKGGLELDYETKSTYTVVVTATDSTLASDSITVTINVVNCNEPPFVTERGLNVSGPASATHPENSTAVVGSYSATGPDSAGATLRLEGTDSSLFTLAANGDLTFNSAPDFEAPADQGGDNVYNVTVRATMGSLEDTQRVTITVENVDEDGSIVVVTDPLVMRVGVEIAVELDEQDEESGVSWQWASGPSDTGPWTNISNETNATYTPVAGDEGNYLRVTANYTDASFGQDTVSHEFADPVAAEATPGTPGTLALSQTQPVIGNTITATLTDADNPDSTTYAWQWERSADGSTNWASVSTSASYTVGTSDAGNYLRATVTYTDDSGAGQTATSAATTRRVPIDEDYDTDYDGRINEREVLAAITAYFETSGTESDRQRVLGVIGLYFAGLNN